MKQFIGMVLMVVLFVSCKGKKDGQEKKEVSRTVGELTMLVDESFHHIINDQIDVFKSDYPNVQFEIISGNERKILPTFLNDSVRVMVLSRMLTAEEENVFKKRQIPVFTSRFAIDGIALITNLNSPDSTITVEEIVAILKGGSKSKKNLVFDNAYSSTLRYFKDLAQISELPKKGIYTLNTNDDVIKYVNQHDNFIGVVGVNWLLQGNSNREGLTAKVKVLGVKNAKGKKGDDAYYKPSQNNLISGIYPFLRNIYIINGEGKNGLGTGFANWLVSQRGQLIVLKSGLGPHKLESRDFNLKD